MKSCSGLARLLTQIGAVMPAHSLVTNTDCPSHSQAPLAALWKDLVVGTALSRKWGPLRFGTEMTGVIESCKAKSASPESQTLSSGGPRSSQGDPAHPCHPSRSSSSLPRRAQGGSPHTLGWHSLAWDWFPVAQGNRGHHSPPVPPCAPGWCSAPSSGNPFLSHPYQRIFWHIVWCFSYTVTRLLYRPIAWGPLCGLPSSRNFTYKSLGSRKPLRAGRKLFTPCLPQHRQQQSTEHLPL